MSQPALGHGIGWVELIFGCAQFAWGVRARGSPGTHLFRPLGLMWILTALLNLLNGRVPETPLVTLAAVGFVAVGVWYIRLYRASRARIRELTKRA